MATKTLPAAPITLQQKNANDLLCERYYWQKPGAPQCDDCHQNHETADEFWERISLGKQEYQMLMRTGHFLPNSPTLFNIGTGMGTLSACFKFDVDDTMESIMDVARKAAMVQKWGGGVGYVFSALRPEGSPIATTHRKACGPLGVLQHYNSVADLVTQGGKRQGAQMGILDVRHDDIEEFIHVKNADPQRFANFNISVALDDQFMEYLDAGHNQEWKIWEMIRDSAWKTGDPGCYFISAAERENPTPWLGKLTGTNPCGEVPLLDNEACNLASINLVRYLKNDLSGFDTERLAHDVFVIISYMDEVLDLNEFPDPLITEATLATRKLGLGVMGWADALALMGIDYDSDAATNLGGPIMKLINTVAHRASEHLAEKKGPYPAWEAGAEWRHSTGNEHNPLYGKRRNATLTSIAPTGTISILAGCSSGIEPHFAPRWVRTTGTGRQMLEEIPVISELKEFRPKTAMEISWEGHVRMQAAFQHYVDLAVSKTINLPFDASPEAISNAYMEMWRQGCKGGTVFRDGCRNEQVLTINNEDTSKTKIFGPAEPFKIGSTEIDELAFGSNGSSSRRKMPVTRQSITHKFMVGDTEGYVHVGLHEDGTPGEVFLDISKQGSTVSGLADMMAVCMSLALQYGAPLEDFIRKMRQSRYEPAGLTGNPEIPTATSITDYLSWWFQKQFLNGHKMELPETGMVCPDCGGNTVAAEGCIQCSQCSWSRC